MKSAHNEPRLLYPPQSSPDPPPALSGEAVDDLQLRSLADAMGGKVEEHRILMAQLERICSDPQIIRYRQAVFTDLLANPQLTAGLEELLPRIDELVNFRSLRNAEGLPLLENVWRLGELELYVTIMDHLAQLLAEPENALQSAGMKALHERVKERCGDSRFKALRRELPRLSEGIRTTSSITLGINLDHYLRPVEAGIVDIHAKTYGRGSFLSRLLGSESSFTTAAPLHSTPSTDEGGKKLPLAPLFRDLEGIVKSSARRLLKPLQDYLHLHTGFLAALRSDILFFLGGLRLYRRFEESGLPVTIPQILPPEHREFHARGLYNPLLLYESHSSSSGHSTYEGETAAEQIVTSNVDFDEQGRIFVVTGPNRGGKTTFTRGVGLCHLLAQAGLFAPARECRLSPAEQIHTHFPQQEQERTDTGRLGDEADRLASLFRKLNPRSLVLLNESLTSTSPGEGVYLARDVLRGLRLAGVRALFTTHFHELAAGADTINQDTEGTSRVDSLVAEAVPTEEAGDSAEGAEGAEVGERGDSSGAQIRRTFRIVRRSPDGYSYARDIARRHGISYEQLRDTLRQRGQL